MSTIRFDMPHALVTLTITDASGVEIEVWPKRGQSAFVAVPPDVAREIATHLTRLADEAEAIDAAADGHGVPGDADGPPADAPEGSDVLPSNVFDLMSRRAARDRGES